MGVERAESPSRVKGRALAAGGTPHESQPTKRKPSEAPKTKHNAFEGFSGTGNPSNSSADWQGSGKPEFVCLRNPQLTTSSVAAAIASPQGEAKGWPQQSLPSEEAVDSPEGKVNEVAACSNQCKLGGVVSYHMQLVIGVTRAYSLSRLTATAPSRRELRFPLLVLTFAA